MMLSSLEIRRSKFEGRKQSDAKKSGGFGIRRFSFSGFQEHGKGGLGIRYSGFFRVSMLRLSRFRILFRACYG
jgi:hypothetical protein